MRKYPAFSRAIVARVTYDTIVPRVVLTIIANNLPEYVDNALQSLENSEHNADIWIYTTSMNEYFKEMVSHRYPKVKVISERIDANNTNRVFQNTNKRVSRVIEMFKESKYDILLYMDSRIVVSRNWWSVFQHCFRKVPDVLLLFQPSLGGSEQCVGHTTLCATTWLDMPGSIWRKALVSKPFTQLFNGNFNQNWCKLNDIQMQTVQTGVFTVSSRYGVANNSDKHEFGSASKDARKSIENLEGTKPILNIIGQNTNDTKPQKQTERDDLRLSKFNTASKNSHSICIAAILLIRIYRGDKAELTTLETEQWIRYLQFAGVDIIYMYDAYEYPEEKLENWVNEVFDKSEVKYHDWHNHTPYSISGTQRSSYQHSIDNYGHVCEWHLAMDIDEYPFVICDQNSGFLDRFIRNFTATHPDCTEISFPNYIFAGYPTNNTWLMERVHRRFPKRANKLDKPLYRAMNISAGGIHHNSIRKGRSVDVNASLARMNHYWCARTQNWKPDTLESLSKTIDDSSILPIVSLLKRRPLISNKMRAHVTNRYWTDYNF